YTIRALKVLLVFLKCIVVGLQIKNTFKIVVGQKMLFLMIFHSTYVVAIESPMNSEAELVAKFVAAAAEIREHPDMLLRDHQSENKLCVASPVQDLHDLRTRTPYIMNEVEALTNLLVSPPHCVVQ
ncbi:hypothetical protein L9F63_017819, partial [Diploptera punctata]